MVRWIAVIVLIGLAAGLGFLGGYAWRDVAPPRGAQSQQQLSTTTEELSTLRDQKRQLEERVEQVTKEQERLAEENEALRKEQTKQQLLTGQGGELPARPPK